MISKAWKGDWPITQPYGRTDLDVEPWYSGGYWHCGIDVGMPSGTPLYAVRAGKVTHRTSGILGLLTTSGQTDYYVHGHYSVLLGQNCAAGAALGTSDAVIPGGGNLTGPHLHFEIQSGTTQINTPPALNPNPILFPGLYGPDGKPLTGGFMAGLTDAQQQDLATRVQRIYSTLFPESADVAPYRNLLNARLDAILAAAQAQPPVDLAPIVTAVEAAIAATPPNTVTLQPVLDAIAKVQAKLDKDLA